jgi:hypothetical protein
MNWRLIPMSKAFTIAKRAYNRLLRPHLPRKVGVYNGIPVRGPRLLDFTDVHPEHEHGLVEATTRNLSSGDDVVMVGGGMGTSAVHASRAVGPEGSVTVYEASADMFECLTDTLEMNDCENVTARHALVGSPGDVWGDLGDPDHIAPNDLRECDLLQLDCEGAEMSILSGISIDPPEIVVESHGVYGAPTDEVCELLETMDYGVADVLDHIPGSEYHRKQDVFIVSAHAAEPSQATKVVHHA